MRHTRPPCARRGCTDYVHVGGWRRRSCPQVVQLVPSVAQLGAQRRGSVAEHTSSSATAKLRSDRARGLGFARVPRVHTCAGTGVRACPTLVIYSYCPSTTQQLAGGDGSSPCRCSRRDLHCTAPAARWLTLEAASARNAAAHAPAPHCPQAPAPHCIAPSLSAAARHPDSQRSDSSCAPLQHAAQMDVAGCRHCRVQPK